MPQGKGTYGSKVGRPSKERTSFVNDNGWNNKGDNSSMLTNLQAATSRQYSNPIDFSNPVQRRGEQIRGTHPIGDPSKPVMRKHPIGDPKEKITGQLMSGDRKAEWSEFMTDMPKGYRTKEEIGAKRKELLAKK